MPENTQKIVKYVTSILCLLVTLFGFFLPGFPLILKILIFIGLSFYLTGLINDRKLKTLLWISLLVIGAIACIWNIFRIDDIYTGYIYSPEKTPIVDATVSIIMENDDDSNTSTNLSGKFQLENVSKGSFKIYVNGKLILFGNNNVNIMDIFEGNIHLHGLIYSTPQPSTTPCPTEVPETPELTDETPNTTDEPESVTTLDPHSDEHLFFELIPPSLLDKVDFENVSNIFDDNFSGNDRLWDINNPPEDTTVVNNIGAGSFNYSMICNKSDGPCKHFFEIRDIKEDNFILYFKSMIIDKDPDEWSFQGIKFRKQLGDEAYLLLFNAQQQYRMIRLDSRGFWIPFYEKLTDTYLDFPLNIALNKQGLWNEYIIYATDSTIEIYANGTLIETFEESNIKTEGKIILCFQADHHQKITVVIDRVIVWELLD